MILFLKGKNIAISNDNFIFALLCCDLIDEKCHQYDNLKRDSF
jgi:hypothetical protein